MGDHKSEPLPSFNEDVCVVLVNPQTDGNIGAVARSMLNFGFTDMGPVNDSRVDYPDYAHKVAKKVKANRNNVGILVCGSGIGMNIAANRHKNIRAAQCFNLKSTKLSRLHNDANIITLGSRLLTKKNALNCVSVFLSTKFEGGRHAKRIKKI